MWDDCNKLGNVRKSTFVMQRQIYLSSYSTLKKTKLKIKMSCEYRLDKSWNWICLTHIYIYISDQSLSRVQLFATPWIAACQASLSITNSRSSLRLKFSESVMPSSHLILWRPLLLLPPIPPSIRIFSNEATLCMRWPKYWSFSFSIIPSKEIPGLFSFRTTGWISLQSKGLSWVFSNTTVQKHQFFGAQPSSQSNSMYI